MRLLKLIANVILKIRAAILKLFRYGLMYSIRKGIAVTMALSLVGLCGYGAFWGLKTIIGLISYSSTISDNSVGWYATDHWFKVYVTVAAAIIALFGASFAIRRGAEYVCSLPRRLQGAMRVWLISGRHLHGKNMLTFFQLIRFYILRMFTSIGILFTSGDVGDTINKSFVSITGGEILSHFVVCQIMWVGVDHNGKNQKIYYGGSVLPISRDYTMTDVAKQNAAIRAICGALDDLYSEVQNERSKDPSNILKQYFNLMEHDPLGKKIPLFFSNLHGRVMFADGIRGDWSSRYNLESYGIREGCFQGAKINWVPQDQFPLIVTRKGDTIVV